VEVHYEDDDFAIINKASGLSVHSNSHRNLTNALPNNLSKSKAIDALNKAMPVHRLDALTSGLVLVAKNRTFQIALGRLFEQRLIKKTYLAIVLGKLTGEGVFSTSIEGKEAHSSYKCIDTKEHNKYGGLTLLQLMPKSGRTHQLRIHCANAGHPILGERLYASNLTNLKGRGLFLNANSVEFQHPVTGKSMVFGIDLPKKFNRYFQL